MGENERERPESDRAPARSLGDQVRGLEVHQSSRLRSCPEVRISEGAIDNKAS